MTVVSKLTRREQELIVSYQLHGAKVRKVQELPPRNYLLDMRFSLPPSTNHLYATVNGRRVLSAEGRQYKQDVITAIHLAYPDFTLPLRAPFGYQQRMFQPENEINLSDWDGRIKLIQDAILAACQATVSYGKTGKAKAKIEMPNDHWIRAGHVSKGITSQPNGYCRVKIWELSQAELDEINTEDARDMVVGQLVDVCVVEAWLE